MLVLTTGGTIDKIYFDAQSQYEIGEPTVPHIFEEVGFALPYSCESLMKKDSLEVTEVDRELIRKRCEESKESQIVITHGTDTMCATAEFLIGVEGKTIVLTGALAPSRFRETDAVFNLGTALGAVQSMPSGVYVAMHGQVFRAGEVWKNLEARRFELIQ